MWAVCIRLLRLAHGLRSGRVTRHHLCRVQGDVRYWRGIALALFCALVVGSVDNVLRPRLVGQDTKMHELTRRTGIRGCGPRLPSASLTGERNGRNHGPR